MAKVNVCVSIEPSLYTAVIAQGLCFSKLLEDAIRARIQQVVVVKRQNAILDDLLMLERLIAQGIMSEEEADRQMRELHNTPLQGARNLREAIEKHRRYAPVVEV